MSLKKILTLVVVFVFCFVLGIAIFFPYSKVVDSFLKDAIHSKGIPVTYSGVDAGLMSTVVHGVTVIHEDKKLYFGDVKLTYSPFSIISKKANLFSDSNFGNIIVKMNKNIILMTGYIDTKSVGKLFDFNSGGKVDLSVSYDLSDRKGDFLLNSGILKFVLAKFMGHSIMDLSFNSAKVKGKIDGNLLLIESFNADGISSISGKGQIRLNMNDIKNSLIDLSGSGSIVGIKSPFSIKGKLGSPVFSFN